MARGDKIRRAYGVKGLVEVFPLPIVATRAPVDGSDSGQEGQVWIDTAGQDAYFLVDEASQTWINAGGGSGSFSSVTTTGAITAGTTLTVGTTVTFSALGRGMLQSSAAGVISSINGSNGQVLIGSTGADAAWANITSTDATVTITNGANTIDLSVPAVPAGEFPTDAGSAVPAAGVTNIFGGTNVNTAGAGNTVTINVDNAPTFSGLLSGSAGLSITAGTTTITSDTNAAQAIYLHANGGAAETIELHADQGTSADSVNILSDVGGITLQAAGLASDDAINIEADAGGVDIDAAMQINIASSEASADAIRIDASDAAGGIDVDDGGGGMAFDSLGAISLDAAAASNFSLTGAGVDLTLSSAGGRVVVQGDEATADALRLTSSAGGLDADVALQMNLDSSQAAADAIRLQASDAAGGLDVDTGTGGIALTAANGTVALESGTGAINIGTDAAAHTITIGNGTGATSVVVESGTGNLDLGVNATDHTSRLGSTNGTSATTIQAGTGAMTFTAGGAFDVNAAGNVSIDSSGGTLGIGEDADAQNINIGTGAAARTINIGNGTGATSVIVSSGTGNLDLGVNATDHTTRVGSTNGTSALTLQSGTGAQTFTAGGAFDVNAVGNVSIDSSGGTLGIGEDADAQNINIGTGAAARTITIGNGTGATSVVIDSGTGNLDLGVNATDHTSRLGSTNGTSATTIQSGTGAMTFTAGGTFDVNASGAITLDSSTAGISLDAATASNLTCAAGDLTLEATTGSVTINALENAAQAIYLHANGGITETIDIHADQGTADTSVNIHSDAGGITLNSGIGAVLMTPQTNSAAGTSLTLNARVGVATFTGQTPGAGANLDLTITNSEVTQGCGCFVTVSNTGSNDADMTLEGVITETAGTLTIHTQNNGAAALNGDVIVTFWIIN